MCDFKSRNYIVFRLIEILKQVLFVALLLVLASVIYVGGMIVVGVLTKFRPQPVEEATLTPPPSAQPKAMVEDTVLSFLIWNIGYAGLGAEADYFYDGGKTVTSPRNLVEKNREGIKAYLSDNSHTDFVLLQEVDRCSKRSYRTDQAAAIHTLYPTHTSAFATNFKVRFLPFPFTNPIGTVWSGLQSLSRYEPTRSERIALPGITDFPRRYFYLDRCLLMQRFPVANGKELVVINAHFEAYDAGGVVKKQQRELTRQILEAEYAKGNYVVLGGDWNIAPPDFDVHKWEKVKEEEPLYLMKNDSVYIPGWTYVYDPQVPTNRKNNFPYYPNTSFTTVIDYYFLSPNVEAVEVKTDDLQFAFSDHQPVKLTVRLKL